MLSELTAVQFVAKWSKADLSERAASQEHFIDLCRLLGQPTPAEHDATGAEYTFEKGVAVGGGASRGARGSYGFADVWWRGKFAWEYKRKDKYADLSDAYRQLCQYREALENPPLLIVSDIARTEIHTNFTGTAKQVHAIALSDLTEKGALDLLRRVFTDPHSFRPAVTPEAVTEQAARQIGKLAQALRGRGHDPHVAAHFLMKCMFCLFAEDVGLLPPRLFLRLVEQWKSKPPELLQRMGDLFAQMRTGGAFGVDEIAYFNGGLFDDAGALELTEAEADVLRIAAKQNWASVEPAIFGTLFERSLDPNTRAQIGAHYTSKQDILLVVEPVVMAPLRREWEQIQQEIEELLDRRRSANTKAAKARADQAIEDRIRGFIYRLSSVRILDPACGSGNFLYVAIQQLLGLEKEVITFAARPDLAVGLFPQVRPTQLRGIEINPYAAELAQVVIWIGYLQWMRDNGFNAPRNPILEPIKTIEQRDAILDFGTALPPEPRHSCRADADPRHLSHAQPEPRHSCRAEPDLRHAFRAVPEPRHSCRAEPEPRDSSRAEQSGGTYLLTWTTYGTWLPGDDRGFVSRVPGGKGGHVVHNLPGEPYDADMPDLERAGRARQRGPTVTLSREAAAVCVQAFREVADKHGVVIHAGAVMATHVHLVVSSVDADGAKLLNLFKGVSSRRLGQKLGKPTGGSWWTRHGSRRLLRDEKALDDAVSYVRQQDSPLELFDHDAGEPRDVNVVPRAAAFMPRGVNAAPRAAAFMPRGVNAAARGPRDVNVAARAAQWPDAEFIIGNPPFLGSKLFRQQGLDDAYIDAMFTAFDLPRTSDLCCYWFELARRAIERNPNTRAGLLATQGIRGGANRTVLERIKKSGDIFMAWSDRDWILDGAAVHVSIVGFDGGHQTIRSLNGRPVANVNSNLAGDADTTLAVQLAENRPIGWSIGTQKGGVFEFDHVYAGTLLSQPNPHGRPNLDVVRPWRNASDLTKRLRGLWIVDFGPSAAEQEAAQYQAPFEHVREHVKPVRDTNRRPSYRERWWIHEEARGELRPVLETPLVLLTPRVAKHRLWIRTDSTILPDCALVVFARSDDYFFGVLHSSVHELWALRMGTQLEDRPRYTPTTCFETFPLPWSPGDEPAPPSRDIHVARTTTRDNQVAGSPAGDGVDVPDSARRERRGSDSARDESRGSEAYARIALAAAELNDQRERWLNPPEWIEPIAAAVDAEDDFADVPAEARELIRQSAIMARAAQDKNLKKRSLTNLYNERPTWLKLAHERLDRAVLAAYAATDPEGDWSEDWAEVWIETGAGQPLPAGHSLTDRRREVDQRVLANLLRLNLARAG